MIEPLRRYADFSGRSRRREFWLFFLFQTLVVCALFALYIPLALWFPGMGPEDGILFLIPLFLWGLFVLAMLVPNAALVARRFHDQGISGVVGVLLYVGMYFITPLGLVILIFMCIDGKPMDNEYGPDPKGRGVGEIFR